MKKEDKAIVERAKQLRQLLAEFGLTLRGFDPGVSASSDDMRLSYCFDGVEWSWIEGILSELRGYRRAAGLLKIKNLDDWEKRREREINAKIKALRVAR